MDLAIGIIVFVLAIVGAVRVARVMWRNVRAAASATCARIGSALANRRQARQARAHRIDPQTAAMMAIAAALTAMAQQSARKGTR
jgi:hypothetical protein